MDSSLGSPVLRLILGGLLLAGASLSCTAIPINLPLNADAGSGGAASKHDSGGSSQTGGDELRGRDAGFSAGDAYDNPNSATCGDGGAGDAACTRDAAPSDARLDGQHDGSPQGDGAKPADGLAPTDGRSGERRSAELH